MAQARMSDRWTSVRSRRFVEWAIVACVIVLVLYVLGHKALEVQGRAEFAAVQTTVGAMRTALVTEHLRAQLRDHESGVSASHNPFLRLERLPANYAGEFPMEHAIDVEPGKWFYDPICDCIGYRLLHPDKLDHPANSEVLGWHVDGGGATFEMLRPFTSYRWFGQAIN